MKRLAWMLLSSAIACGSNEKPVEMPRGASGGVSGGVSGLAASTAEVAAPPAPATSAQPGAHERASIVEPPTAAPAFCVNPQKLETREQGKMSAAFEGFSLDGELMRHRLVFPNGDQVVALYDVDKTVVVSYEALRAGTIATSFDGKVQITRDKGALTLHHAGMEVPLPGSLVNAPPDAELSLSAGGRYLVVSTEPRVIDLHAFTARKFEPAVFAGGSEALYTLSLSGHILDVMQSRRWAVGAVPPVGEPAIDWTYIERGTLHDRDARVFLAVPHAPHGGDYRPTFVVSGEGRSVRELPLTVPSGEAYRAALCPAGNLAVVAYKAELHVFQTQSGRRVLHVPFSKLAGPLGGMPDPFRGKGDVPDQLELSPRGDLLFVKSGEGFAMIRLVP